VIPSPGLSMG